MKFVVATVSSTLMRWWRASLLLSPTVLPASILPWRWTAPVRARMASRSVVLPLWNGPTSATQRGPVARVAVFPLAAITALRCERRSGAGHLIPSFQRAAGLVKRRDIPRTRLSHRMQLQGADAASRVEPNLALDRQRLQRNRMVRSANKDVGAGAGANGRLAGCAHIGS